MKAWADIYRRMLADVRLLAHSRGINSLADLDLLLDDMEGDALDIERAAINKLRSRRLQAEQQAERDALRAAEPLPLFEEPGHAV